MTDDEGGAKGGVAWLLRLEGLCLLTAAALLYWRMGFAWQSFAIVFLAPDLSFIGYVAGPRVGAAAYNAAHSTIGPLALGLVSAVVPGARPFALIWAAHVGFDRALGYGLKYASGFSHTHLGRIGKARRRLATQG